MRDTDNKDFLFRFNKPKFTKLEDHLFQWIEIGRRISLELPSSLVIQKAKLIVASLGILEEDFKGSWEWCDKFSKWRGLGSMVLHGEGGEVVKENSTRFAALEDLYKIVKEYDPSHVYNMDET